MSKIEPSTRRVVVEETIAEPKDFEQVLKTTTKTIKHNNEDKQSFQNKTNKQGSLTTRTDNVLKTKQINKQA